MECHDHIKLMHDYLDRDLTMENESILRNHLERCEQCQRHFHELSRTITLIQSTEQVKAPVNFTEKVMNKLPKEKKHMKYKRWFKSHPILTAAAMLFLFFMGSLFSSWTENSELVVSKQEDIIIEGDTVIVPEHVTVMGDLFVKNGDLKIKGTVDGNVTLVNGNLIYENGIASSFENINGDLKQIDQVFKWMWYEVTKFLEGVFDFH